MIVTVPKFKVTKQFGLQDTLSAMGMRQAFDSHSADFSGMIGEERQEKDRLYISAVIHKAYVAVPDKLAKAGGCSTFPRFLHHFKIVVLLDTGPSQG